MDEREPVTPHALYLGTRAPVPGSEAFRRVLRVTDDASVVASNGIPPPLSSGVGYDGAEPHGAHRLALRWLGLPQGRRFHRHCGQDPGRVRLGSVPTDAHMSLDGEGRAWELNGSAKRSRAAA